MIPAVEQAAANRAISRRRRGKAPPLQTRRTSRVQSMRLKRERAIQTGLEG